MTYVGRFEETTSAGVVERHIERDMVQYGISALLAPVLDWLIVCEERIGHDRREVVEHDLGVEATVNAAGQKLLSEVSTITYEAVQLARGEMGQRTRWRAPSGRAGVRDSRYPSHQR
jgi:hypothetical protein